MFASIPSLTNTLNKMSLQANTGVAALVLRCSLNYIAINSTQIFTFTAIGILNKLALQLLCLHLDGLHYRPKLSWCRPNIHHKGRNISFDFLTQPGKIPGYAYLRVQLIIASSILCQYCNKYIRARLMRYRCCSNANDLFK